MSEEKAFNDFVAYQRLVHAAPDMLAELRAARDYLSCIPEAAAGGDDIAVWLTKRIDAVIEKATGESA
jgi:hypothetical protein